MSSFLYRFIEFFKQKHRFIEKKVAIILTFFASFFIFFFGIGMSWLLLRFAKKEQQKNIWRKATTSPTSKAQKLY